MVTFHDDLAGRDVELGRGNPELVGDLLEECHLCGEARVLRGGGERRGCGGAAASGAGRIVGMSEADPHPLDRAAELLGGADPK